MTTACEAVVRGMLMDAFSAAYDGDIRYRRHIRSLSSAGCNGKKGAGSLSRSFPRRTFRVGRLAFLERDRFGVASKATLVFGDIFPRPINRSLGDDSGLPVHREIPKDGSQNDCATNKNRLGYLFIVE